MSVKRQNQSALVQKEPAANTQAQIIQIALEEVSGPAKRGLGWMRDLPDIRDLTLYTSNVERHRSARGVKKSITEMLQETKLKNAPVSLPAATDLRAWFSPVEDQGSLGSCTANAGVGILEYFERRAFGRYLDASRLFLYKATRDLLHWTGDTGAYLRSTMEAMTMFGVPPEEYLPYDIANFDDEPSGFCYAFAQNYQAISYFRLDPAGTAPPVLLERIKSLLYAGIPSMFGFTCYTSLWQSNSNGGNIPFPAHGEHSIGGHALVVAGYDDSKVIVNTNNNSQTTGAFLIRNSWGAGWGQQGYGWFPYDYILTGLAVDWWSLLKAEWVATNQF